MVKRNSRFLLLLALLALLGCTPAPGPSPTAPLPRTPLPTFTPMPPPPTLRPADLLARISRERLLADVAALAAIEPESGWRSPGTTGEQQAVAYVAARLDDLAALRRLGMGVERQSFRVPVATEIWEAGLWLTLAGGEVAVPAGGLQVLGDRVAPALRMDSDGILNDSERNPLTASGPVARVGSADELAAVAAGSLAGDVALVDYALLDPALLGWSAALANARLLLAGAPAGLVLVTRSSPQPGESHGTFLGDGSPLPYAQAGPLPPVLSARLEDLAPWGIAGWEDLAQVQAARLTWDADVLSPATSANVVAHIPGRDPSHAVLINAHLDSANAAGAMDDASGAAVLLEIARVLDEAAFQPPADLYLAWFGSEELGSYGSSYYVSTHQELLDRILLMVAVDCLTSPLGGVPAGVQLDTWASGNRGDDGLLAPSYLSAAAARHGLVAAVANGGRSAVDNLAFATFDVPNAQLYYGDAGLEARGFHYSGRIHDPYDRLARVEEQAGALAEMAGVVLVAALETGREQPALRDTPPAGRRALLVGSHCEVPAESPANMTDLAATLALAGYDVDALPYGQALTAQDLQDTALVIVLPVLDYPGPQWGNETYDESWSEAEAAALEAYVAGGGFLVLTNSAYRLDLSGVAADENEDWADANLVAGRFGVTYQEPFLEGSQATVTAGQSLVTGTERLAMAWGNGVSFAFRQGTVLAQVAEAAAVALVPYGDRGGRVLVLAEAWMLAAGWEGMNSAFWENLGR